MDIFFNKIKLRTIASIIAFFGCVSMVMFPEMTVLSAQKGISLWASSVLPALFPFFICVNFMNYLGAISKLSPVSFTFTMSVMSGYPVGAKIIGDMSKNNCIKTDDAKRLISFCSTSGPIFMLGVLGIGMLGSMKAGVIILISHYLGAVANGVVFSAGRGKIKANHSIKNSREGSILDLLTDAISESLKSMGIILAYIVIFMFITDMIQYLGLFTSIDNLYGNIFVKSIFEMTVGCATMNLAQISLQEKIIISSMIVSFGGISIMGQSLSMLSGSGIPAIYYIKTKIFHSLWAGIIAFIIVCIFM